MDVDQLFPSEFWKAGDIAVEGNTFTIIAVHVEGFEEVGKGKKKMKLKGVITFKDQERQLVLNRTNGECFKAMWGREVKDWLGKRVTLCRIPYFDPFKKEQSVALRVLGSPDLKGNISTVIKLRKKEDTTMTLLKTAVMPVPPPLPKIAGDGTAKPVASSMTPEQAARKVRGDSLWKKARGANVTAEAFKAWSMTVLGREVRGSELTDDDLNLLEVALPDLIAPPPAEPFNPLTGELSPAAEPDAPF